MASFECEEFLKDLKVESLSEYVLRKDDWIKLAGIMMCLTSSVGEKQS